jgi:hypothetical protein
VGVVSPGVRGVRALGGAAVAVVVVVHVLLCGAHAAASGAGGAAGGAAIAGLAPHHGAVIGVWQVPHGTRPQVSGGDGAVNVGHVCVKAALEDRTDASGVPASAGPPLPLSCAPVAAATFSSPLVRVTARDPARCMILRC